MLTCRHRLASKSDPRPLARIIRGGLDSGTRRSVRLMTHVTPGDAQLIIRALAFQQGRSVSDCLAASTLSQARVPTRRASQSTPELRELRRELAPIGSNWNQTTRRVHQAAATADETTPVKVSEILAASKEDLARLGDVLTRILELLVAR